MMAEAEPNTVYGLEPEMFGQKLNGYFLSLIIVLSVLLPAGAYVAVFAGLFLHVYQHRSRALLNVFGEDPTLLLVLCSVLLSTVFSEARLLSFGAIFVLLIQLSLYAMLRAEAAEHCEEDHFKLLILLNIAVCLYGVYQYLSGNLTVSRSWVDEKNFGFLIRIYSTFGNPNVFAGYLVMHLSFALARMREKRKDILLVCSILSSSLCLLLTYSRGAFLGLCASITVLYILRRRRGLILYGVAMMALFISLNHTGRAALTALGTDSSSLYRLEIWKSAIQMFLENPILGNGYGTAWYYLAEGSDVLLRYVLHAHNIYLQIAAETGMIGLAAVTLLAYKELQNSICMLKSGVKLKDACWIEGFIAMIAAVAAHGFVDAVIFLQAFVMAAMIYSALYKRVAARYAFLGRKDAEEEKDSYVQDEVAI